MKEPLLSILIPVYGVERWIERCAVSLFEQDYENIEYIFVDDCTQDDSITILCEVVSRYPNRVAQVRILRHEKNRGLAAARNTAFDAASGEYIRIVDSDDFIPQNSCSLLMDAIHSSNSDVIIGGYYTLLSDSRKEITLPVPINERNLKRRLCGIIPPAMWSCVFSRQYLNKYNLRWKEGVNISEDYMMMTRILLLAKTSVINDIVYNYDLTQDRNRIVTYPRIIQQLTNSTLSVWEYYTSVGYLPQYQRVLELALINPLREEHRSRLAGYKLDSCYPEVMPYLNKISKAIAFLLRKDFLYNFGNYFYKIYRALLLMK